MSTDTAVAESGAQTSAPAELSIQDRVERVLFGGDETDPSPQPQDEPLAQGSLAQDADAADEVAPEDLPVDEQPAEPQTAGELELIYNGTPVKVSMDEVKNLAQQGYHLSKQRESVEGELAQARTSVQKLRELVEQTYKVPAEIEDARSRMRALEIIANGKGLNQQRIWEMSRIDPAKSQEMQAEFNVLAAEHRQLSEFLAHAPRVLAERDKQAKAELGAAEAQLLYKLNPNWKDPKQFERNRELLVKQISNWRPESVEMATSNAEVLDLLVDGAKYRQLQQTKREALTKANRAPAMARPGPSNPMPAKVAQQLSLRQQIKKSSNDSDRAKSIQRYLEAKLG